MNVLLALIIVTIMLSALTLLVASPAAVTLDTLGMESPAMVRNVPSKTFSILITLLQILMNVLLALITVTIMQSALTLEEASPAGVTLDTLGMESPAKVRSF